MEDGGGLASLAAVSVMGWNVLSHVRDADNAPRLAAAQPAATQQVMVSNGQDAQVMLRDPRLDELLAAHKQYGALPPCRCLQVSCATPLLNLLRADG